MLNRNLVAQWGSFLSALRTVENGIKAGWDKKKKLWFPHPSPEGGTKTIAYGHKLPKDGMVLGKDVAKTGLTEDEALDVFEADVSQATSQARFEWDKYISALSPKPGVPSKFDDLALKFQAVLVNLVFNTGSLWKGNTFSWPTTSKYIIARDEQKTRSAAVTTYVNAKTGKREKLKERARIVYDAIHLAPGAPI